MKHLLHFRDVRRVCEAVDSLFLPPCSNQIVLIERGVGHASNLSLGSSPLKAQLQGSICFPGIRGSVSIDTLPSADLFLSRKFFDNRFSLAVSASPYSRPLRKPASLFKSDCLASVDAKFVDSPMKLGFFVGRRHSKAFSILGSVSVPAFSASLGGIVQSTSNVIEVGFLSRNGVFSVLKVDVFNPREFDVHGGWIFRSPSSMGYVGVRRQKLQIQAGLEQRLPQNVEVSVKGRYRWGERPKMSAAFKVKTRGTFQCSVQSDGTARMLTKFRPAEWMKAVVRSETQVHSLFKTVGFGWSLCFTLPTDRNETQS
jgi:hypothetical protein